MRAASAASSHLDLECSHIDSRDTRPGASVACRFRATLAPPASLTNRQPIGTDPTSNPPTGGAAPEEPPACTVTVRGRTNGCPPTMPEPLAPHLPGWNWFAFALLSLLWAAAWRTLSRMLLRRSAPLRQLSRRCTSASRAKFPKNVAALLHAILGTLTGCAVQHATDMQSSTRGGMSSLPDALSLTSQQVTQSLLAPQGHRTHAADYYIGWCTFPSTMRVTTMGGITAQACGTRRRWSGQPPSQVQDSRAEKTVNTTSGESTRKCVLH